MKFLDTFEYFIITVNYSNPFGSIRNTSYWPHFW